MNGGTNKRIEPVCRFGPGGDFVAVWPEHLELQPPSWKLQYAFKDIGAEKRSHRSSAAVSKCNSFSSEQPMLFPDDRVGPQAAYRPTLRTQARRRTTEKRIRVDTAEQNLLFTDDIRIARTA
jgi:hypothetical protein